MHTTGGDGGGVSRSVVVAEEYFFPRQMGPYFPQFVIESAQSSGIGGTCDRFALF